MRITTKMRRVVGFLSALILISTPGLISAQDGFFDPDDYEFCNDPGNGAGLTATIINSYGENSEERLEQYVFTFEPYAWIPYCEYPEAMVIQVRSGSFFLYAGSDEPIIVDPYGNEEIEILDDPVKVSNYVVANPDSTPCFELCLLPVKTLVRIDTGDTVIFPGDSRFCLCNVTDQNAELTVFATVPGVFSWTALDSVTPVANRRAFPQRALPGFGFGCR
jgi:hypothetical protein